MFWKVNKQKIKKMLKTNLTTVDDIDYIVRLCDRWQYQPLEIKKQRLTQAVNKIKIIPIIIFEKWINSTMNLKSADAALFYFLEFLIELLEVTQIINYWKTEKETAKEKEKIKDLIKKIKSFI